MSKEEIKNTNSVGNTGSVEFQVDSLNQRIKNLSEHLEVHRKDNISRRGLLVLLSKRKKFLSYLKKK